jgi:hypothetical protein
MQCCGTRPPNGSHETKGTQNRGPCVHAMFVRIRVWTRENENFSSFAENEI